MGNIKTKIKNFRNSLKRNGIKTEIRRINNLTSDILSIGQKLYFVEMPQNESIYIVQKGDTLYSVSKKFNLSIDDIKRLNNQSLVKKDKVSNYLIF